MLADYPGHVVVRPDVTDRPRDVGGALALVGGLADRNLQQRRAVAYRVGRLLELAARPVVHASQCRMFKDYGHEPIVRHRIRV